MRFYRLITLFLLVIPALARASFIESSMGAAVVNDATATYFNPAALTLLKNAQLIPLGTLSYAQNTFTGQYTQLPTNLTLSGRATSETHFQLPSLYIGIPVSQRVSVGFAVVSNFFNSDIEGGSILRYSQSTNHVSNTDAVVSLGLKLTNYLAIGGGLNLSYADFLTQPIVGFPTLNIPDSQTRNESDGTGFGQIIGALLKPTDTMLIGFTYRTSITYPLTGRSISQGNPPVISENYGYPAWTPGRAMLTISQLATPKLSFIATIQRIQWNIFNTATIHGIAARVPTGPVYMNAVAPFHFHNAWLVTLGTQYRMTPKFVVRFAASYNQSSGNPNYQISNGDTLIVGTSMGYKVFSNLIIDGSYAHGFIQNQPIHVTTGRNFINGINEGFLNAYALKLTLNFT